uniref:Arginine and serine rich coiled-coil 1 n=1 Tax=Capra hircus TaxID=9925 RepID=A0A452EAN9_CAPHI
MFFFRRRHRSSSSSSYGSRRKRSRSRSRGRGKSYRVQRSRSKSRTRRESGNIKAGLEHLPPAEQAKARLQLVLEAAAKADEALKAKERNEEEAKRRKEEGKDMYSFCFKAVTVKSHCLA